ncbi:glycoside hydrolase [Flavobacteriaceae bacterium CRH]|nr:glycoside hydrolase [Flavobacteriaceae bacterium CRH]
MKAKITLTALLLVGFTAVQAQKYDIKTAKTYAEISAKTDGKWEGKKYIGGTVFKNVDQLKLAPEHTDHSFDIRYEGPGWESNKIGYRLYLDWRNAIDIFGKKTSEMILPKVGQDNFDSYHEMSDWGADILKAGKGIGIGSIDRYLNNEKLHFREVDSTIANVTNKTNESNVKVRYYGWKTASDKIDFTSELTIKPDQLYTQHTIKASKEIKGICTGIVKQKNTELIKKESKNKKWAYLATYGAQSLVPDKLGMAIFYEVKTIENVADTDLDYLLVFKPTTKATSFYFLGAWEQQTDGVKTQEEFVKYLDQQLEILNKKGKM